MTLKIVGGNDAGDKTHPGGMVGALVELFKFARKEKVVKRMHLVETLALGGKKQLMLVECWGRKYLVGCGPDAVQAITAIEMREPVAAEKSRNILGLVTEMTGDAEWV